MNQKIEQFEEHATLIGRAVSAEALEIAAVMHTLAAAGFEMEEIDGATFALLPPGYAREDLSDKIERVQDAPRRKRGTLVVKDVASLLAVLGDQVAQNDAYVFADPDTRTIVAVLNEHRATPGWRDHRVSYTAAFTPEFERWLANSGKQKTQTEFAEFIEDNLADVVEPAAHQLLDVATTLQATTSIEFRSAKRLDNGQTQLTYVESVDARAGADSSLSIPREFALGLRIFKQGEPYKLRARLKYRMNSGKVLFWYELDRPERTVEHAFAGYVQQVRDQSGYTVLIGTAGH